MRRPLALVALLALALAPALPALAAAQEGRVGPAAVGTFANDAGVAIANFGVATPYPSAIEVSGVPGGVADLDVTLRGLRHTFPADVDVLLVGPHGQTAVLLSDVGQDEWVTGVTLTLDDEAAAPLPANARLASGTFRPTNNNDNDEGADSFPAPAPAQGGGSALSAFHGTNPNGAWKLYAVDDTELDAGSLAGWDLRIVYGTTAPPKAKADAFRVKEDRTLRKGAPGVLANDVDVYDDPLTARAVSGPAKGTLTLNADGSFVYKPRRNFHGTDRFTYEVTDPQGFADRATVTITVLSRAG